MLKLRSLLIHWQQALFLLSGKTVNFQCHLKTEGLSESSRMLPSQSCENIVNNFPAPLVQLSENRR